MRCICTSLIVGIITMMAGPVYGASLLKAASFPDTFSDLKYTQRMDVLAQGYEVWESEYDDSGRCIRGCSYVGMTIDQELAEIEQNTQSAMDDLRRAGYDIPAGETDGAPAITRPSPASLQSEPVAGVATAACVPNQPDIPPYQTIPLGKPLVDNPRVSSPYGRRVHPVTKKVHTHTGMDFDVPTGTLVFSPANGVVDNIWRDATCGYGMRIRHSDGYDTVYCHLSRALVSIGDTINAGCSVAQTGNTGRSTGPHLHYSIKHNGKMINPTQMVNYNPRG